MFSFRKQILTFFDRDDIKSHDRSIFHRSDEIMNESELLDYLTILGTNRCKFGQRRKAGRYKSFFNEEGNKYIDKRLKNLVMALSMGLVS